MKAEAQAQSGDNDGAKTTLNILLKARTRTGATTLTCDNYPAMSGLTALQMVQLQTRIELWGEGGREFFNNKRWGVSVDRTSWLDLSLGRFRTKRISLPRNTDLEYKTHIKSLVRISEKDDDGNVIGRYIKNGEDHYAHARNYAEIALPLALAMGYTSSITQSVL